MSEQQAKENKIVRWGVFNGLVAVVATYVTMYFLNKDETRFEFDSTFEGRLKLLAEALVFPCFFALAMVIKVGSQRFGNPAQDPTKMNANSAKMKTDIQILQNTFEQTLIFVISLFALSAMLPAEWLWVIPTNGILFITGRVLFFTGYHINPLFRAPGFAMGLFSTLSATLYCCAVVAI